MDDDERRSIKEEKEYWSRVDVVSEAQQGIPKLYPCGKLIKNSVDEEDSYDYLPGKRYFICTDYENDGLHFRQPWVQGVEEEVERLKKKVLDNENCIRDCLAMIQRLLLRVSDLERVVKEDHVTQEDKPI